MLEQRRRSLTCRVTYVGSDEHATCAACAKFAMCSRLHTLGRMRMCPVVSTSVCAPTWSGEKPAALRASASLRGKSGMHVGDSPCVLSREQRGRG